MHLLIPKDVASLLSVSTGTLEKWRRRGIGPAYLKLNRGAKCVIRYRREAVDAYLRSCELRDDSVEPESPLPAAASGESC